MARKKTEPEVEALMSGGRFLADFFAKLTDEVVKRGGKLSDIHRLVTDDGKETREKIADLIVSKPQSFETKPANIFPVTVNYDLTTEEMVKTAHFDWVNSDITVQHFPSPSISTGLPTKVDLNLELVHFNRPISSDEAKTELKKQGLRPATIHELLAFGAKYPEEQKKYLIVALGSVWQSWDGDRFVACLYSDDDGLRRALGLLFFRGDWDSGCRFAAVRR